MLSNFPAPMNVNLLKKITSNVNINDGNLYHHILNRILEELKYNVGYIFHPYIGP